MADRQPKLSTPVPIIFILIGSALAIAQISVGAIYLDDCPKQPYIPIYLLVLGVILLVLYLSSLPPCNLKREDGTQIPKIILYTGILVFSFLFCWLIAGSVWIYSIYQPNYTGTDYCNKTLYLFAFWTTTLIYILLGIFLLACFFTFLRKKHQTPLPQV